MAFTSFDPLTTKQIANTDVAANAAKKEIENILNSYVGWFDPFCELIQNSLDSVEERILIEDDKYLPKIRIIIDIQNNKLCVSDNGTGLNKKKFEQFLAPSFSFKSSGKTRGHKGVGATYLAYGFNYIQISTKADDLEAVGKMENARAWLSDEAPAGNPEVIQDKNRSYDTDFIHYDKGVSICIKFDKDTNPGNLSWLKANTANQWKKILLIKTGLGSFKKNENINVLIKVISSEGKITTDEFEGIEYFWPHQVVNKSFDLEILEKEVEKLFSKKGPDFKVPPKIKSLDCIFGTYDKTQLIEMFEFTEDEKELINKFVPSVSFSYMYSTKIYHSFNDSLNIRKERPILLPGIQICANNMPQGEIIQIPLNRNIGRQNQMSSLIHYENCVADLGRKGFQSEAVELAKTISRKIIELVSNKYRAYLRVTTGVRPDLIRQDQVENWKKEMEEHETQSPIILNNPNFFLPIEKISITSTPTREQDVIALFNQMIAGGVIRGLKIMSTNERFTYDGMYRIEFSPPYENHLYDQEKNPLGIDQDCIDEHEGFRSSPKILEYKFNLDALIEDIESGIKNSNEIDLVVVWECGTDFQGNYEIVSLLDNENLSERPFHGITHIVYGHKSGQTEMYLIVLKELIQYLNHAPELAQEMEKYN